MASPPGKTKTSLEIDSQLWKDTQKAAIDRDLNKSEAIEAGLRLWLHEGGRPATVGIPEGHAVATATAEELEIGAAAIAVLREGNPVAIEMLDTLLRRYRGRLGVERVPNNHSKKRA